MRAMTITADSAAPRFTVQQHTFNLHLASGKWSVHIDTRSGKGRFYGPCQNEGTIYVLGKVVSRADQYLPRQVIAALTDGGFDCGAVEII